MPCQTSFHLAVGSTSPRTHKTDWQCRSIIGPCRLKINKTSITQPKFAHRENASVHEATAFPFSATVPNGLVSSVFCCFPFIRLHVLREPSYAITVALAHNDRAHEHLDGSDALKLDLPLTRCLVHTQLVSELVLGDGLGVVDLVAQDDKRHLGELLHCEESVELGLRLGEALVILCVDEEDDTVDFGEVISPDATGCGRLFISGISGTGRLSGISYPAGDRQGRRW